MWMIFVYRTLKISECCNPHSASVIIPCHDYNIKKELETHIEIREAPRTMCLIDFVTVHHDDRSVTMTLTMFCLDLLLAQLNNLNGYLNLISVSDGIQIPYSIWSWIWVLKAVSYLTNGYWKWADVDLEWVEVGEGSVEHALAFVSIWPRIIRWQTPPTGTSPSIFTHFPHLLLTLNNM